MDYNISTRPKDNGIQAIISFKVGEKWKQKSKQGFKKVADAKRWAQNEVLELKKLNISNFEYQDLTFKELADIFLNSVKDKYAYNTLEKYRIALKHYHPILEKKYNKITSFELQEINDRLHLSNTSKETYLKSIKAIFNFAINKLEILGRNPANKVVLGDLETKKYVIVTKEEFYKYIYPNLSSREDMALIYKIAFSTGLRCSELLGLTYDSIQQNKLVINKQWNLTDTGGRGFKKLKTANSYREVPITKELYEEIIEFKNNNLHISQRLFYKVNASNIIGYFYKNNFKGKKYENMRLHDLRHSFVSILIEQGLDFKIIAELIGDTLQTTINTYSHINSASLKRATKVIVNYFWRMFDD